MSKLIITNNRRFGVEIELNTTTNIIKHKDESPDGADLVGSIIHQVTGESVSISGWHYTNNNDSWVIKPDGSCGIEICTPILKGYFDLIKLVRIIELFSKNEEIKSDQRCSLHVHVNLDDLNDTQIGSILGWWIKCEGVFFDSLPQYRRCSRHTQLIGISESFEHDKNYSPEGIIERLSEVKYHSVNAYHMRMKRRRSIEFRIAENTACLDPFFVKNWIRLLLHFVEMTKDLNIKKYSPGNAMTGLLWLNPKEVFEVLKFNNNRNLSPGLKQVKTWFINRLMQNSCQPTYGLWKAGREKSIEEIDYLARRKNKVKDEDYFNKLYSVEYVK